MHIPYITIYHFLDHTAHRAYRMTYSKLHTYSRNRCTSWLSVSRFGIGDDSISITSKGFQLKAKSTDQNLFSSYNSRLLSRLPVQLSFSKSAINIIESKHLHPLFIVEWVNLTITWVVNTKSVLANPLFFFPKFVKMDNKYVRTMKLNEIEEVRRRYWDNYLQLIRILQIGSHYTY